MASASMEKSFNSSMKRSSSGGALQATGKTVSGGTGGGPSATEPASPMPYVPRHLSVSSLTKQRKLPMSTGNLHGYMAEDYSQVNWPLPKMFGKEKYGYSLIDVEVADRKASRYPNKVVEIAQMSKKLIRLQYDQQIIDLEWRKTYKLLLNAEHQKKVVFAQFASTEKTKKLMTDDVAMHMKYLMSLQEQKDMYQEKILEVYANCDAIRTELKQEYDLEELRNDMEKRTRSQKAPDDPFWKSTFNVNSAIRREGMDLGQ